VLDQNSKFSKYPNKRRLASAYWVPTTYGPVANIKSCSRLDAFACSFALCPRSLSCSARRRAGADSLHKPPRPRPAALAATYVKARIGESASPIQQGGGTVPAGDWLDVAMRLTSDAHCFVVLRYSTYEFGGESHKYPCVPSPYLSLLSRAIVL